MRSHGARWWLPILIIGILLFPLRAHADTVGSLVPVSGSQALLGISCPSSTVCVVVGRQTGSGPGVAAVVNGGTPSAAVTVPGTTLLNGVACVSVTLCYAVGRYLAPGQFGNGNGVIAPLTINGSTVSPGTAVTVLSGDALGAIACPTSSTCYVVSGSGVIKLLTANGTTVTPSTSPNGSASVTGQPILEAIACPTSSTCYVTGQGNTYGLVATVAVSSSTVGTPSVKDATGTSTVGAISCVSSTLCYGAGDTNTAPSRGVVVAISNGSPGSPAIVPNTYLLLDIACRGTSICSVVGRDTASASATGAEGSVAVSGTTVTPATANTVPNTTYVERIACPTTTVCEMAGNGSNGTGVVASVTPTPTASAVVRFTVQRHAGTLAFRWQVASAHGIAGFRLYAGDRHLSEILRVHSSHLYVYQAHSTLRGPYRLTVLFRNGRQLTVFA